MFDNPWIMRRRLINWVSEGLLSNENLFTTNPHIFVIILKKNYSLSSRREIVVNVVKEITTIMTTEQLTNVYIYIYNC